MKHLAAALFVLAALPAQAQDLGPICPDRPGKGMLGILLVVAGLGWWAIQHWSKVE